MTTLPPEYWITLRCTTCGKVWPAIQFHSWPALFDEVKSHEHEEEKDDDNNN